MPEVLNKIWNYFTMYVFYLLQSFNDVAYFERENFSMLDTSMNLYKATQTNFTSCLSFGICSRVKYVRPCMAFAFCKGGVPFHSISHEEKRNKNTPKVFQCFKRGPTWKKFTHHYGFSCLRQTVLEKERDNQNRHR